MRKGFLKNLSYFSKIRDFAQFENFLVVNAGVFLKKELKKKDKKKIKKSHQK